MQHTRCGGAASLSQPSHSTALLLLRHARCRHRRHRASRGTWIPIQVHGGGTNGTCCWSVGAVDRPSRRLQPKAPPPPPPSLFLVPPLTPWSLPTARPAGSRQRQKQQQPARCFASWSSGAVGGGATGLIGGASAALAAAGMTRDLGAACFTLGGAYCLVLAFDNLAKRRLVEQALSRKLVHVLSGVLFLLTWPMFSTSPDARFFAAVVPLLNFLRLLAYGLAVVKDEALIKSVTRYGKREELLRGPLYYVIALLLAVLVFWRESPVGLVALSMMSGGDGFADIVGRRFGSAKLPFNKQKSWAGSVSMFIFGSATSVGMLYYYWTLGFLPWLDWDGGAIALKVALVALAATAVESLPLTDTVDDNVSVPLASMLAGIAVFGL